MIGSVNSQEKNKSKMLKDMMQECHGSIMRLVAWSWFIRKRWGSWKPGGEGRFESQDLEAYTDVVGLSSS